MAKELQKIALSLRGLEILFENMISNLICPNFKHPLVHRKLYTGMKAYRLDI